MNILDFSQLLAPISEQQSTGKDLRAEDFSTSLYRKIKDARTAARNLERQQTQGSELTTKPDWHIVYEFSIEALSTQTKDLEITAWLIEALLREHGFAGLREGFLFANELIKLYWENLYPLPDEDGLITRLAPLTGLNGEESEGTLITPIALTSLTKGHSEGPFALWQYQQAVEVMKIADNEKRKQRLKTRAVTLEKIAIAISETPQTFLQSQLIELQGCIQAFKDLTQTLEEKAGTEAPPTSRIFSQLNACIDCLQTIAKENLSAPVIANTTSQNTIIISNKITETNPVSHINTKHGITREQALSTLLQIADFFRQTEPHSPLPYILERTARWGKMSLPQLIKELIKDEQALGHLCNLTGIINEK